MTAVSYINDAAAYTGHKSTKAAKFVGRKTRRASVKIAKSTFSFTSDLASFALKVLWYMLIINLMAMGFIALGLSANWAIVPFFFLVWKGII